MKLNIRDNNDNYNKYNIITDEDITMTNVHTGDKLSDIITEHDTRIEKLESNVKWMYRYGALGSGGTGGSGSGSSSSKLTVLIWKDGTQPIKPGATLMYPGEGYYTFKIDLHGGGTDEYNLSCTYFSDKTYRTDYFKLNSDNSFIAEMSIKLSGNNDITFTIQNTSTKEFYKVDGSEQLTFHYVTSSYNLSSYYVKGNEPTVTTALPKYTTTKNTIFMSNVMSTGIMVAIDYNIAVDLQKDDNGKEYTVIEYNDWEDNTIIINKDGMTKTSTAGVVTTVPFDMRIKSNSSGVLYLPLASNINEFLSNNENASFKQVTITVTSQLKNELERVTLGEFNLNDNLIPNGLFLNIRTDAGKIYNTIDLAKTAQLKNQMTMGDVIFNVTPYNGPLDISRPYTLDVNLYNIDTNNNNVETEVSLEKPISVSLIDQRSTDIAIPCSDPGIKKIKFTLTSSGEQYIGIYYIRVKELSSGFDWYPKTIDEPFFIGTFKRNDIIKNIDLNNTDVTISKDTNIQMTSNDVAKTITFDFSDDTYNSINVSSYDSLFGVGLQYYSINDTSKPILSFNISGSTKTQKKVNTILLFQDKLSVTTSVSTIDETGKILSSSSNDINIFIPFEDDYEPTNTAKYHLFNIYKRLENVDSQNPYRSVSTYIDGILEGLFEEFETAATWYTSMTLYPGNYSINLLEYSLFKHTGTETENTSWLEDIDIDAYAKAYNERIVYKDNIYSINDIKLYEEFAKFTYDDKNRILVQSGSASNIASYAKCPVLVLNFTDSSDGRIPGFQVRNQDNFMSWFEESIGENMIDSVKGIPVTLQYSDGKSGVLNTITLPGEETAIEFSVDRQGSSTKTYRCKNLELNAPKSRNEYTDYIYSPNMVIDPASSDYTNSFLPERSFTLKADVVDSSHTNNNAIGKFVNDNTTPFNAARNNAYQHASRYKSCIKNCLVGFPVLLFLNTTFSMFDNEGKELPTKKTNHYFLGIYNFNLGRNSFFNLGYKDVKYIENIVDNLSTEQRKDGFVIYEIDKSDNVQMPILGGAEIQGNNAHYDFSQYTDTTILFGNDDPENPIEGMWGDFIGNDSVLSNVRTELQNLCFETAFAGGYTFTQIGKQMSTDPDERYGYSKLYSKLTSPSGEQVSINGDVWTPAIEEDEKYVEWVPNYHYQAERKQDGSTIKYNYIYNKNDGTLNSLRNLILTYDINENEQNVPRIDFISLAEYYTTMMAFGLVDSPMKNLNVKSWNSCKTFYLAFYDMDTGLGKNNAGTYINYFAFSDFWRSVYKKAPNADVYEMEQVGVIRDYSPASFTDDETGSSFFDVPSTYLFAIAKYAKSIFKRFDSANYESANEYETIKKYDPSNIWGKWRRKDPSSDTVTLRGQACLRNADYFMNTYFNKHLANIPTEAFNFNYRFKYLVKESTNTKFHDYDFMKFHGRGIAYTRYWLDGRLHILDAYFNVNGIDDDINIINGEPIKAPFTEQDYRPNENPDVYILQDAFVGSDGYSQYTPASSGDIDITAKPYAPFILEQPQFKERYLFPFDSKMMRLNAYFTGNVTVRYSGSKMWTSIGDISHFIKQNGKFSIYSKYISSLSGNRRTCDGWALDTPALRTLRLTSEGYSGSISFNSSISNPTYQNLDEINISNTAINLSLSNVPLRKLYATNMQQGASIVALDLSRLEDVQISGIFNDIQINSWNDNIILPSSGSLSSRTMTIKNDPKRFPNASITIGNNNELTQLNLSGFSHININNCESLTEINIEKQELVETLSITMSRFNDEPEYSIKIGNVPNTINLTNFTSLHSIRFTNTTIEYINLPNGDANNKNNIMLLQRALYGCKNFINFTNEAYNNLYITGEGTFYNCGVSKENGYRLIKNETIYTGINAADVISNIYVDESCTSLKDTFNSVDSKGKIDYQIASVFLTQRCSGEQMSNVRNVTTIDNMFKNNKIDYEYANKYIEYYTHTCTLPLWEFVSCSSANDVFSNNNVNFFNRYMFEEFNADNLGHKLFDCLEYINLTTMSNTFAYGTIDMLYPFMNKLTMIDFKQQPSITIYDPIPLNAYNLYKRSSSDTVSILYMNDMFVNESVNIAPTHLTVLKNFSLTPASPRNGVGSLIAQIFSFEGLFDNDKTDSSLYKWKDAAKNGLNLLNFMNNTYTVKDYDVSYVNKMFCNIVPIYIVSTFSGFSQTDSNDLLNIYTMFNWSLVKDTTKNLFCDSFVGQNTNMFSTGINVKKHCTYDEFHKIWYNLLKSTNLVSISSIFTDCVIINNTWTNVEFTISDSIVNTSITTVPMLFSKLRLVDANEDIQPIDITSDIFKCMRNLIYVASIFEYTYMKHAIPFDVFGKRREASEIDINNKNTCKIKISDTGDNSVDYVNGKLMQYDYDATIQNMSKAFYNVTFTTPENATFRKAAYNKFSENYAVTNDDPDTKYYEYYKTNLLGELVKYNIEQPSEIVDMRKLWIDLDDNTTTNNLVKTSEKTSESLIPNVYRGPHLEKIGDNYEVKDYSTRGQYYYNLSNFCNYTECGFVVSPDIFRCCAKNCDISQSISFDRTSSNTSNNLNPVIMNGMMPPSIFSAPNLRTINFGGTFYGLNVVPIELPYYDNESITVVDAENNKRKCPRNNTYYQYILNNFTDRENLNDCFNFTLLLPSSKSTYYTDPSDGNIYETQRDSQVFIMFGEDSFSKNITNMQRALPIDFGEVLEDNDVDSMHNFYKSDNGIYFNITRKFMTVHVDDNPSNDYVSFVTGIDKTIFRALMFDNLINGHIAKILDGNILLNTLPWQFRYISENAVVFFQVGGTNSTFTGLSSNARIQATYKNDGIFPKTGTGSNNGVTGYHICKSSLPDSFNFDKWSEYWMGYSVDDLVYILT